MTPDEAQSLLAWMCELWPSWAVAKAVMERAAGFPQST